MSGILTILLGWVGMALAMAAVWWWSRRINNAGIVDIAWSLGVAILATVFCVVATDGLVARRVLIAILALVWGIRLSWHVWQRVLTEPEDGRYVELKRAWGASADFKMFRFYQLQAAGAVLFALPMFFAAPNAEPWGWLDWMAIGIWVIAVAGESIADRQLARFKHKHANDPNAVCNEGLWRYSRHPNYFFEWLHWWTYVALAWGAPWGFVSVLAPIAMWHFIVNVTGIPPNEAQSVRRRGDAYRKYQQQTSAFIPWFPKTESVTVKNN